MNEPPKDAPQVPVDSVANQLQSGDIIMKCGYGMVSNLIIQFLDEDTSISHCAIVDKSDDGKWTLAHSISGELEENDGVQTITLKRFLKDVKPKTLFILRPSFPEDQRIAFARKAFRMAEIQVPFDHDFNNLDTTELYCSEFVNHCFKGAFSQDCFNSAQRHDLDVYLFNSIFEQESVEIIYTW